MGFGLDADSLGTMRAAGLFLVGGRIGNVNGIDIVCELPGRGVPAMPFQLAGNQAPTLQALAAQGVVKVVGHPFESEVRADAEEMVSESLRGKGY